MDSVRKGAAVSAVNLGSQLFRKAAAGSSYLKGHTLRGHAVSSRSIPPLQGEQQQVKEGTIADEEDRGADTLLVPLFKPDHTQDGPACACLQALEPYTVLCCSAGAYAGNYFFISKDVHGEVLGGGPHLVSPAPAAPAESAEQQEPQRQQQEATVRDAVQREKSGPRENHAVEWVSGPLQGQEHHTVGSNGATATPHIIVAQQQRVVEHLPIAELQEGEKQLRQVEEQPKAQAHWQPTSQGRLERNPLSGRQEPAEADQEAETRQQAETCRGGRPLWPPRAKAEQRNGEDKAQRLRRREEQQMDLPQVDIREFMKIGRFMVEEGADQQQQQEGTEEQRCTEVGARMEERRTACNAGEQQVGDFKVDDVTMRIEHAGLSAVHARIWEDPGRKHLEDRLNIQDLSSEEGTWKKVRWDRPIPLCRCSSSPRSGISSGPDTTSVASDNLSDDQVSQEGTEDGGEEGVDVTGRAGGDKVASQVSVAQTRGKAVHTNTEKAAAPAVVASEVEREDTHTGEGGGKGETAERQARKKNWVATPIGSLSCDAAVLKEGDRIEACPLADGGASSTGTALSGYQHTTARQSDSPFQRGQSKRSQRPQRGNSERRQPRQQRHQQDMTQQKEGQLKRGQPQQSQNQLEQLHGEKQQPTIYQQYEGQHMRRDAQRWPKKEGQQSEGLNRTRKERRMRRRQSSSQLVNFSGRLLRFERGPPLSPSEAFDEFLLTFELQHLKSVLLACLRERGCCCSRACRTRTETISPVAAPSSSMAGGPQPPGSRTRGRGGGLRAAAPEGTREEVKGAPKTKVAEAFDTEHRPSSSRRFAGGIKGRSATMRPNGLATPEASRRREGFHQWNRLAAIRRIRRDKVCPMHAAATYSSEDCTSMRESARGLGVKRWASLVTARSHDVGVGHSTFTDCMFSVEEVSDVHQRSQDATEATGNILHRGAGDEDDKGKQSYDALNQATCDYFRSSIPGTNSEKPASTFSRSTWWRNRLGAVEVWGGEGTKRKGDVRPETSGPKAAWRWERQQSCCCCSSCEADPLRWLWRIGPLSLLYQEDSGSDLTGRKEAGDGEMSMTAEDATTKKEATAAGGGTATRGTLAAAGAPGRVARHGASRIRDKGAQKRRLRLPETPASQTLVKNDMLPTDGSRPHTPLRLLLTPEEADRWRMACVELPRHFLPVSKKSRPLTIYDEATGSKLGEVRWSGCFLISSQQGHIVDRTGKGSHCAPRAVPDVAATAATTLQAGAASQQPTARSQTADANQNGQRHHAQLGTPFRCQVEQQQEPLQECQQQQRGQPQLASIIHDRRYVIVEHSNGRARFHEGPAGIPVRESVIAQAADSMTFKGAQAEGSSSQAGRASTTFRGASSAPQMSKPSCFGGEACRQLDAQRETEAACGKNERIGSPSNRNGCLRSVACSSSSVSTRAYRGIVSEFQTTVVSATQASENASAAETSLAERALHSGQGSHTTSRYDKGTPGGKRSSSRSAPSTTGASGSQGKINSVDTNWSNRADPLEECDCWLVSSVVTQEDRRPLPASSASSRRKSNKDAGVAADDCIHGEKPPSAGCTAVSAKHAGGGVAAAGGTMGVAVSQAGAETAAAVLMRPTEVATLPALSTETSAATSAAGSSGAAPRRPEATPAAGPRLQTTAQAGLQQNAPQQQRQNVEEIATHGEDAPAEAIVQRLRTSSVSLLLQGRLFKKPMCGSTRTAPRSVNSSSLSQGCKFHERIPSCASGTNADSTPVSSTAEREALGIQSVASGPQEVLEKPQHDSAARQSHNFPKSPLRAHTSPSCQQRRDPYGPQRVGIEQVVDDLTKEQFLPYLLPSSSPPAVGTPAQPVRRGGAARHPSRRWSVGIDGLLHWTSSRRHSSNFEKKSGIERIERISTVNVPSRSSQGSRLFSNSIYSGPAPLEALLTSSNIASGGESTSSTCDCGTLPGESICVQEYPVFGLVDQLRKPAGLSFSSNNTQNLYSSSRTLRSPLLFPAVQCGLSDQSVDRVESVEANRVRHVTAKTLDAAVACPASDTGSNHLGPRRATNRRSLAAAAAAPVFAVVRSAAAAMAAVAPAVLSAGAVSGVRAASSPAVRVAPVGSSCTGFASRAADSSTAALVFDSSGPAAAPLVGAKSQTAESVKGSGAESAISAIASAFAPAACRAVADRSRADNGLALSAVSAAASTFLKFSTASLTSVASGGPCGAYPKGGAGTLCSVSTRGGSATSPAVSDCANTMLPSTMNSAVSTSGAAADVIHPATLCPYPLRAHTPTVGATVAGAIRSSIRRRRSSFCRREGNTCHFPLLAPARAASCFSSHPLPMETSHTSCGPTNQSAPVANAAAQLQTQNRQGMSLFCWSDARLVADRADAAHEDVAALPARSTALPRAAASASAVGEASASKVESASPPVTATEHVRGEAHVKEHALELLASKHSSSTELLLETVAVREDTTATKGPHNSGVLLTYHSKAESAALAVTGEHSLPHIWSGAAGAEANWRGGSSGGDTINGRIRQNSCRRVNSDRSVLAEATPETKILDADKGTTGLPSANAVRAPALSRTAATKHQPASTGQHFTHTCVSRTAKERGCSVDSAQSIDAAECCAAQVPAVEGGCLVTDWRGIELPMVEAKMCRTSERDSDVSTCGKQECAPLSCESGRPRRSAATARSGACSGNLAQYLVGADTQNSTIGGKQAVAAVQTNRKQQVAAEFSRHDEVAGTTVRTESLPVLKKNSDEKLHVCAGLREKREAADQVGRCESAVSSTSSTALSDKEVQDSWSPEFSLVHEARHRTSPETLSSGSSECSGMEDQERTEIKKHVSASSSSKPGGSDVELGEQTEESPRRGYLVNLIPRTEKGSNTPEQTSICLSDVPGCATDCKLSGCRNILQDGSACATSQRISVSEEEETVQQVKSQEDSERLHGQEMSKEQQQLLVPVADLQTAPLLQNAANGPPCVEETSNKRESGSTSTPAKPRPLIPRVNAAGRAPGSEGEEDASLSAQHQVDLGAAVRETTDTEGVAEREELKFQSRTEVDDVLRAAFVSTKQNFIDDELREGQSTQLQQQGGYEADKVVVHTDYGGSGSESSAGSESGDKPSGERVIMTGRGSVRGALLSFGRSGGADPTGGTPKAKGELKRLLFSLRNSSNAKTPPRSPLQGQLTEEERTSQEAEATSAVRHASPSTFVGESVMESESAELPVRRARRAGGSLATQHGLKRPPTSAAECIARENADAFWNEHPAPPSATRKFFSFGVRPSTPANARDGDERVCTHVHESGSASESYPCPTRTSSNAPDLVQQSPLVMVETFSDAAGVAFFDPLRRKDATSVRRSASVQESNRRNCEGKAQAGGPASLCRELADTRQNMDARGQLVEASKIATNAPDEGGFAGVLSVDACASTSQGEAKSEIEADALVCSDGDCLPENCMGVAAEDAATNLKQGEQTSSRQSCEARRGWVKRTEGRCSGALSTLQLVAAAQYVATRKKVAARLVRKQVSGAEEMSSGTSAEATPVPGRGLMVDVEASAKRRGGRVRLFPYRKYEGKKGDAGQYREEDPTAWNEVGQSSGNFCRCSSKSYCSCGEAQRDNPKLSVSEFSDTCVQKYEQNRNQQKHQEDGGDNEHVLKVGIAVDKLSGLHGGKSSVEQLENEEFVLMNGALEGSAPARMAELTDYEEEPCHAVEGPRRVHENELRLLLQAQAYLLRQNPRRQGFPEVIIPAAADDKHLMCEPAGKSMEASLGRTTYCCEAKNNGPEHKWRTIKPCYAHSAASEHWRGLTEERTACPVPPPPSPIRQRTSCEGLQYCETVDGRETASQSNTGRLQKRVPVNEDDRGFAGGDFSEVACNKRSKKVLCVYAAGEFQLLLAEPEDEDGDACASESVTAAGAAGATADSDHSISSCRWRTCSCWVRLQSRQHYRLRPGDVLRVGPSLEFSLKRFLTGVASQQGYRLSMEDEEVVIQDLGVAEDVYCSFFAVYDGHGGRACAEFVKRFLHVTFRRELLRICGGNLSVSSTVRQHVYQALLKSFLTTDAAFLGEQQRRKRSGLLSTSGCACVVVVILGGEVWCANCGDARAVLCRGGKALELSSDHKPHRKDELQRIVAAGGFVRSKRVLGRLAVSRAFGDVDYKGARGHCATRPANMLASSASTDSPLPLSSHTMAGGHAPDVSSGTLSNSSHPVFDVPRPLVTAVPEIRMQPLCEEDEFLLLACDGLFDVFTSQEAADFVREALNRRLADFKDPQVLVDALLYEAIEKRRSRDNVTAILVLFSPAGRSVATAAGGSRRGDLRTKELE